MADHLPSVYLSPWLPQKALLGDFSLLPLSKQKISADKRLSIFITHGGMGSTTEIAHLGKPSIMVPIFFFNIFTPLSDPPIR